MLTRVLGERTPKKFLPRWTAPERARLRAIVKPAVVIGASLPLLAAFGMLARRLHAEAMVNEPVDTGGDATHLRGGMSYADSHDIYKSLKFD